MPRTTIEFGDDSTSELNRLTSALGGSKVDILRNALSLYGYLFDQLSLPGKALGIVSDPEKPIDAKIEKVIVVPGFKRMQVPATAPAPSRAYKVTAAI